MPGKPNRPLFELLREPPKPGVRERAAAADAGTIEAKPNPEPAAPRAAAPSRIEVMKPALAARETEAVRPPEPFVRIKKSAVALAIAAIFGIALLVWVIAYTRGKAVGVADTERTLGFTKQPAKPNPDPLNTKSTGAEETTPPELIQQGTTGAKLPDPRPADPKAADPKKPAGKQPPPKKTPAPPVSGVTALQVASGTGEIMTPAGRTNTDPRAPDINYLVLTIVGEEDASDAIAYLSRNGLESFSVPNKGDRRAASGRKTVVLIAATGITADQYKRKDPIRTQLEQEAAKLGVAWKKAGGSVDFNQAYWQKFER